MLRPIERVITARRQLEGGGFSVRRPLPAAGVRSVDPILMIDEMGPVVYAPGEAVGAPDHPHRGFETVTYLLDGHMLHEDHLGNRGNLKSGGVQWMTAGADGARFLLLAARPLKEPVVQYGPFVMNTRAEIEQAIRDYQNGVLAV